ncbi:hypothetical protein [Haloplanus aerogenes]|uniref:Uncharacterized protein n=1 Tax=Haloplanus aerogenes TaxID=660522 RepID=A0A3M0DQP5_9EURY|nr:hypothetical protein [Haloplanus aerogenes]AZH24498.1 hypothetical protein DU502_03470 [Haloplanus aerogenes]RMB23854.1 hypothetical protein ATH50_1084 [Haloplanus aerogenes]
MRAEFEDSWHPSTKLNVVGAALDFTRVDPLPENVARDEIEEYCYTLEQLYGSYIERIAGETVLSQREAQTWVLRNLVHEGADRLTFDAIGLYVWAIGRSADGDPLSRTIVADYHDRAREKLDDAEATVKYTQPPPYPDDLFDEPTMLWVEGRVAERLARRREESEGISDTLDRLLDETTAAVPLATLLDRLRDERDAVYVGVQTVRPDWDRNLPLSVHVPEPNAGATPVADAEVVRVGDRTLPFSIEERAVDTGTGSMLTLWADGEVDPETGVDHLREALASVEATLPELVDRAEAAGAAALAVGDQPVGAGCHLLAVGAPDDLFSHLDRLLLVDRTLAVERVTTPTVDEYDSAGTTLLWTAPDAGLDETRALPDDPVERRDRLPTAVLRTG